MTEVWREKYRPRGFDEMVGCNQFIQNAKLWVDSNLPPALLFIGPPGTGKTTAARVVAIEYLKDYYDPINYYVTNASDERGIDFVRELKTIAKQGGVGSERKIIHLDEADNMTSAAQKALRQVMETTSSQSTFILTANERNGISDAIRDRCLIYDFSPHTDDDAKALIRRIHEHEGLPDTWREHYGSLNRLCGGSLRSVIDILQGTRKESEALVETLRHKSRNISQASLDLVSGNFENMANHLRMEIEKGASRFEILQGLRYRAKNLFDDPNEYYSFMLIYGEFMEKANVWADDNHAFIDYFVAKLMKEKNEE
jgi:replication factor C small subunit